MNQFRQWVETHAPSFSITEDVVVHDNLVVYANQASRELAKSNRRPAHHYGIRLADVRKHVEIHPAGILVLGPHMQAVEVNEQAAWMGSLGKAILAESVIGDLPEKGTIVAIRHGPFYVGIGKVAGEGRAIDIITDVGRLLRT